MLPRRYRWPWGGLLARALVGPERRFQPLNEAQARPLADLRSIDAMTQRIVAFVRGALEAQP